MPSFKTLAVATVILFIGAAQAQYYIDPTTIDQSTKNSWCESQQASCPLLCLQLPGSSSTTSDNTCDPTTLDYSCVCGNGLSPNASEYSQTIPYFECVQWGQNCVAACDKDSTCQSDCIQLHPCGAQDPTRVNTTSSSSATATGSGSSGSATAATTSGQLFSGFGATSTPSPTAASGSKSAGERAMDIGRSYGTAMVLSGVFAGFAIFM